MQLYHGLPSRRVGQQSGQRTVSAEPVGAAHPLTDESAAGHALTALRRDRLVHSWQNTGTGFDIVVGRGTVRLGLLDPAGVLRLADQLRRDEVTIVGGGYALGYRTVRYNLSDGRFAARHDNRAGRL